MPSSLSRGPVFRFLNVVKKLSLQPQADAPIGGKMGDLYVTDEGVLMIHNGTAWVAVGGQS